MSQNNLDLLSVNQLLDKHFYIPSYQRGYRWTKKQVTDLLDDILDFTVRKKSDYEFYCLQPLVLKPLSEQEKKDHDLSVDSEWYEVIDGQQRLTTICLILKYLKGAAANIGYKDYAYELRYERENQSSSYVNQLDINAAPDSSTIDHYYLTVALSEIHNWLEKEGQKGNGLIGKMCNALLSFDLDEKNPPRDRANNVRFIWYESIDENPIKVFTRLNIGKIPLTNAELIKALLLRSENFKGEKNIKLRQQEIASEWDNIEYALQNDEFWLFMHEDGYTDPTRIDFIFDMMREHNELKLDDEKMKLIGTDKDRTFRYFYEYFKSDNCSLDDCWGKVKFYFQTLSDWFNNIELYHYVGFLIDCKQKNVSQLIAEWRMCKDRNQFIADLKVDIKTVLDKCPSIDYQYKEDGSDKTKAKPILLFHNIQMVVNQNKYQTENEKYHKGAFYKFPFHLYKKEKWDVEHINSNTTNSEDERETQKEWLFNWYLVVNDDLKAEIKKFIDGTGSLQFDDIKSKLPSHSEWDSEEKNRIWNYCLLDSSTNRSYGNALFSTKRRIIISKEKGEFLPLPVLNNGKIEMPNENKKAVVAFVPPCTRNVFMKYYSPAIGDSNYWTLEDAQAYLDDIKSCIEQL